MAAFLKDAKAAVVLGWWEEVKSSDVAKAVSVLFSEVELFRNLSRSAWSAVDGCGTRRVSEALLSLFTDSESVKACKE